MSEVKTDQKLLGCFWAKQKQKLTKTAFARKLLGSFPAKQKQKLTKNKLGKNCLAVLKLLGKYQNCPDVKLVKNW